MKNLLLSLLIIPVLAFAQVAKKYPTLLWKISGNNIKKPSYLYGTMHVSNRVAYYLSEQFFEALKSVDVVGLETNPGEWLENMEKTGELSELNQFRGNSYSQDFYRSAFTVKFPEKKVLQSLLSYDPDIINGLLYRQNRTRENFEESTYIDLFIYQSASKLNKQLISLEDFSQSEIKARLSALPDEAGEESEKNYNNFASLAQKIEDAYREGNLDMLDSLSKLSSSKNTQKYLINDRNVFFVNTIDSVLKNKSLFSGVGAAHLPGETGVIELLRKRGYTVEPVIPKVTKKSHDMREALDLQVKEVTFQRQTVSDSLFSLSLPGKLYPIINLDNLKYSIYADMVNGNFYTIMRLKHMAPIFNISKEQMMLKIDSLLFESIPGKILEKKEITLNNGIRGLDIVNRIRRGDEQHYQIYFTDDEMILFKLGGKEKYATGNDAKRFFSSISFSPKPDNFVQFSPKTKGFSVKLPANYAYLKNDGSSAIGPVEELYAYSTSKKESYGVKRAVYNDFYYLEEDTFELNRLYKNILVNYNYTVSPTSVITREAGLPCIRFSSKNNFNQYLNGKVLIKGVHYYFVYTIGGKQSGFDNDFFNSFKLMDFEFVNTLKEVTDKDFCFKAIDEVTENALSRFNEAYAKAYELSMTKKDTVVPSDYEYRSGTKYYYSPSSNEYVNITLEKYNDYDYRDKKEVTKKISDSFKYNSTMIVSNVVSETKNGFYNYRCTLKDTGTSRAIDWLMYVKNGLMLGVCAPYDTTIGLKGWTKGFIDSFTPKDTVLGKDIFENKFTTLLNDLCSSDTVKRQAANVSLRSAVGMQKAFGDEFIKFISGNRLNQVSEDSRAYLFVNGGTIQNEKILPPYKQLYKQYTDSFYLQLCLLKGLAYLKTKDSYQAFNQLLMSETPLVGSDNTVKDVFSLLHDSLELCRNFFPGMLALTKYDEYREAVYTLMADLVNQKLLAPSVYAAGKDAILIDANLAHKRYNPASNTTNTGADSEGFEFLDKNLKELAENLKVSLEALANNNFYKDNKALKNVDFYSRPALVNYAYILAPFYKSDEKTKQFLNKLVKIKAQNITMPITINLLKQNISLNDTLVEYYCKNKYTRIFFYSELEKEKLTDKFEKKYLSQQNLVYSYMSSQKQLNALYNSNRDKNKKDSMALYKEIPASNKYQNGRLYVYKTAKSKTTEEQWSVAFVANSKEPINSKIEVVSVGYFIDPAKTEQENINELLDYFYMIYRKRANPESNTGA